MRTGIVFAPLFALLVFWGTSGPALVGAQSAPDTGLPRPAGFVSDFAGVIPRSEAQQIEGIARAVQERTGAEIAIVTIESFGQRGFGSIAEFGVALAEEWQVGDADSEMGVILMLAMQERQIRIEVGYGLEGALPDGRAGAVIDQAMVPAFQQQRYGEGFLEATRMIAGIIGEETGVDLSDAGASAAPTADRGQTTGARGSNDAGQLIVFLLVFMFLGGGRFIFWPLMFGRFRRGFYGGGFGSHYRGYRSGGRGFGGGGIGGGGFGGFGGGGFGGGGASRGF